MGNVIATFTNIEDAMTAFVTEGEKGFHVSLRDDDSMEFAPFVTIFPTAEMAIEKAKSVL